MLWKSLLQQEELIKYPWTGEKSISSNGRSLKIEENFPTKSGWASFKVNGRKCSFVSNCEKDDSIFSQFDTGYLIGDHFVPDSISANSSEKDIFNALTKVYLIDENLDLFARVKVGKLPNSSRLIFLQQEISFGAENEVLNAFLDKKQSLDDVKNVHPALYVSFKIETWRRNEEIKIRLELEKKRQEEEKKKKAEEKLKELQKQTGTSVGRREIAKVDFETAAKAALSYSGAEFLSATGRGNEKTVRFRFKNSRYECVCDSNTLMIIDAGICVTNERTGFKWDSYLSLESLPAKIAEAQSIGKLVVFRRVDATYYPNNYDEDY